jgi:hypothetical protein
MHRDKETQTDTETQRHRDAETETQTETQTQKDRDTYRETPYTILIGSIGRSMADLALSTRADFDGCCTPMRPEGQTPNCGEMSLIERFQIACFVELVLLATMNVPIIGIFFARYLVMLATPMAFITVMRS